jgi:hypothetical protein
MKNRVALAVVLVIACLIVVIFTYLSQFCLDGAGCSGSKPIKFTAKIDQIVGDQLIVSDIKPFVIWDKTDFVAYMSNQFNNRTITVNEQSAFSVGEKITILGWSGNQVIQTKILK